MIGMDKQATRRKLYVSLLRRISSGAEIDQPAETDFPIARIINEFEIPGTTAVERENAHRRLDKIFEHEWQQYSTRESA